VRGVALRAAGVGSALVYVLGCGAAVVPASRAPDAHSPSANESVPPAALAPAAENALPDRRRPALPQLSVQLHPRPGEDGAGVVEVSIEISAPAAQLASWHVPASLPGTPEIRVVVESASGSDSTPAVELTWHAQRGESLHLPPAANLPATLHARLAYQLLAPPGARELWHLDQNWFLAQGSGLLVLPSDPALVTEARLAIDASAYGQTARAVSSLGIGPERRSRMTLAAVKQSLFAAGSLGSAVFDAPEGHDEAAWFGFIGFDSRLVAAEVASFRTAVRELLSEAELRPLTMITTVERDANGFEVLRAPGSVLVRVSPADQLTAGLRLSILHQVLKEWIGGQLTLFDERGAELVWFTEGICRFLAQELALEFGLVSPAEFAAEVNAVMGIQAVLSQPQYAARCAPAASTPAGSTLAANEPPPHSCNVLQLARGALHATELENALRTQGSSLVALLARLLASEKVLMAPSIWLEALRNAAGPRAVRSEEEFAQGQPVLLTSSAFGPCFTRERTRYPESKLGLPVELSPEQLPWTVTNLDPSSPAFAAGLRPGAIVRAIDHVPYDAARPIRLWLADGSRIEYLGPHTLVPSYAWKRVAGVHENLCRMSGRSPIPQRRP